MSKRTYILVALTSLVLTAQIHVAAAAGIDVIPTPADLPPGAMSYGNIAKSSGMDPNIVAAIIGVLGLLIGSFLTILGTYFLRFLDVRREDRREEAFMQRERREKELQIKQEIYKNFLTDLGVLEGVLVHKAENAFVKDADSFNAEWTKMEIKMNLVCSTPMRELLNEVQDNLMWIADKHFKGEKTGLTTEYLGKRSELLDAIRADIDLFDYSK